MNFFDKVSKITEMNILLQEAEKELRNDDSIPSDTWIVINSLFAPWNDEHTEKSHENINDFINTTISQHKKIKQIILNLYSAGKKSLSEKEENLLISCLQKTNFKKILFSTTFYDVIIASSKSPKV